MEEIRFKDVLIKALYMEEGEEQINVAQGSELLKCVLEVLANDYTDEEILYFINKYRKNKEETTEDYPEKWAYPDKNLRTKVELSQEIVIDNWAFLPLTLLIDENIDERNNIKATDMEGTPLEVKKDPYIIHGPQIYYINIKDVETISQNEFISLMVYYNDY